MARKNSFTVKQMVDSINRNYGIVTKVANELGCTTQTVYNYRDKHTSVAIALQDQKNRRDDYVEGKLYKLIDDEHPTAIIFYSKTQMKHRGYVERQELKHDGKLELEYVNDWRHQKED